MFRPPRNPDLPARATKKRRKVYHCFCGAEIEITRDYIGRVSARCNSCLRPWRDNPLRPLSYPLPVPEPEDVEAPRGRGRTGVVLPFRRPKKERRSEPTPEGTRTPASPKSSGDPIEPTSHVVDITAEFLGRSIILTGLGPKPKG